MTYNTHLILCSKDMHGFMQKNFINNFDDLFQIPLNKLVLIPNFPYRLLIEWVLLRDKFNLLCEN